jgi:DUF1680 family protein
VSVRAGSPVPAAQPMWYRLMPSIPGYIYAQNGNDVFVNLFISGTGNIKVNNKALTNNPAK